MELESLRTQSQIWKSDNSNEHDKLMQENVLLRSQLQTRCEIMLGAPFRLATLLHSSGTPQRRGHAWDLFRRYQAERPNVSRPFSRLGELQTAKNRSNELDADKQRLIRDVEDLNSKLQWLQKINAQARYALCPR